MQANTYPDNPGELDLNNAMVIANKIANMIMKKRLRKKDVQEIMRWSASTLNERVATGRFIKPTYEGKTPFWLSTDVDQAIDQFFSPEDDQDNLPSVAS
jgi:hypothetical protein